MMGFIKFILLICLSSVTAIYPPTMIIQSAFNVYFKPGEPVILHCQAIGNPRPRYFWKRNEFDFSVAGTDDRFVQLANVGTIVINNPESKDEAIYQCFADNGYGVYASIKINLREAILDDFPPFAPLARRTLLGESLTLRCLPPNSVPIAEIFWIKKGKNGSHEPVNYNGRVTMDFDFRLRIVNVRKEDEGEYACMAVNKILRSTKIGWSFTVIVVGDTPILKSPYYIWATPTDSMGLVNDTFRLQCIYGGNPTPELHWEKLNGDSLPDHVSIESSGQELVFNGLQFSDTGDYVCSASNSQSIIRRYRTFFIRTESRPYWIKEPENVVTSIGKNVNYTCGASGIPKPEVQWYINGLKTSNEYSLIPSIIQEGRFHVLPGGNTVELVNVTREDTMVIQCNVTNKHGYIFGGAYINVV